MRIAIYIGLVFLTLLYWAGVPLESYFSAPHVGQSWDELLINGSPARLNYWGIVQGSGAVLVDLYIFILPMPIVAKLHLSTKKRLQLICVFFTAFMQVSTEAGNNTC